MRGCANAWQTGTGWCHKRAINKLTPRTHQSAAASQPVDWCHPPPPPLNLTRPSRRGQYKDTVADYSSSVYLFKTAIRRTQQTLDEFEHVAIKDRSSRWQQSNKRGCWTLKKKQKTKCLCFEEERQSLCGNANGLKMFSYMKKVLEC